MFENFMTPAFYFGKFVLWNAIPGWHLLPPFLFTFCLSPIESAFVGKNYFPLMVHCHYTRLSATLSVSSCSVHPALIATKLTGVVSKGLLGDPLRKDELAEL